MKKTRKMSDGRRKPIRGVDFRTSTIKPRHIVMGIM
jgi:hypothetical protein